MENLLDIEVVDDIQRMEEFVTAVESKGPEQIDGTDTEQYTVTVDTADWLASLPEGSIFRQMTLPDSVTMDLYVDDDSLPVRLAYEVPDKPAESAQIGFTEWGTPVEVAVPGRAKPVS